MSDRNPDHRSGPTGPLVLVPETASNMRHFKQLTAIADAPSNIGDGFRGSRLYRPRLCEHKCECGVPISVP